MEHPLLSHTNLTLGARGLHGESQSSYLECASGHRDRCRLTAENAISSASGRQTSRPNISADNRHRTICGAKFQQFDTAETASGGEEGGQAGREEDLSEDRVFPADLQGAVLQSSEAAALFVIAGGTRAAVELLLPDLENLSEDGAQQQLWTCARLFISDFQTKSGLTNVKAVFPDAGAAAMVQHQWGQTSFSIASLTDRQVVKEEDEAYVLVAPDWQMLADVEKIAAQLTPADGLPRPLILWNQRLVSGDVGVGLNVRRLRERFLGSFTCVYHIRPNSAGAIFKCFPEAWKLFLDDGERPGRYTLLKSMTQRPTSDDIDEMFLGPPGDGESSGPSAVAKAFNVIGSLQRFMRALSQ